MAKLSISAKCTDLFNASLTTEKGTRGYDGYVPDFMPGQHWGDYVMLDIDVETGKILNWKAPSAEQLNEVFGIYE